MDSHHTAPSSIAAPGKALVALVCLGILVCMSSMQARANETLRITQARFDHQGELQPPQWRLKLVLSHPVAPSALMEHVVLERNTIAEPLVFSATDGSTWDPAAPPAEALTEVHVRAATPAAETSWNRLRIRADLASVDGHTLERDYLKPFDSQAHFTFSSLKVNHEENTVRLTFSAPLDKDQLQRNLRLTPPAPLQWWRSRVEGASVTLHGTFAHGTEYLVSLPEGMPAANGMLFQPAHIAFTMPDMTPSAAFASGQRLIERDSRQMLHVELVNVERLLVEALRLPPLLAPHVRKQLQALGERPDATALSTLESELRQQLERLPPAVREAAPWNRFVQAPETRQEAFFTQIPHNESTTFSVPLTFRQEAEQGAVLCVRPRGLEENAPTLGAMDIFSLTDLGLSYKRSHEDVLVWVTSLRHGTPVGDVSVLGFTDEEHAYYLGQTDDEGILRVGSKTPLPLLALGKGEQATPETSILESFSTLTQLVAANDTDRVYTTLDFLRARDIKQTDKPTDVQPRNMTLFTERGMYRAGETVHFKGVVRDHVAGEIVAPATGFVLQARNPLGETIHREEIRASTFGTVHGSIPLPGHSALGAYTMTLQSEDEPKVSTSITFNVESFQPPRHLVDVRMRHERRPMAGYINMSQEEDVLEIEIAGRYYTGGPVKNGRVRWRISTTATSFPQEDYPHFTFSHTEDEEEMFLETGESILDASGEVIVTLPLEPGALRGDHAIRVTATVVDFDGRAAAGSGLFQHPAPYLVGLNTLETSFRVGQQITVRGMALDAQGQRQTDGFIRMTLLAQDYVWGQRRDVHGDLVWTGHRIWREVSSAHAPLTQGEAAHTFTLTQGGEHLLRATYAGPQGEGQAGLRMRTTWDDWHSRDDTTAYTSVALLTDRAAYGVGDTIRIRPQLPRPLSHALVTLERDGVMEHRVLEVVDGVIGFPVTEEMRPTVYVSMLGTLPRGAFPNYQGKYDDQAPSFVFGAVRVDVRRKVEPLRVALGTGSAPLEARPGQTVTLGVRVTGEDGQGVAAEVALAVVDEQVLALSRYRTPSLDSLLEFTLPLRVHTGDSRTRLQAQTPFRRVRSMPLTGGDGEYGAWRAPVDGDLREDFNPVAFWHPALLTDEEGRVEVEVTFPDTMTTYRIFAVVCDQGARVGSAERPARVTKPFYLEPGLPRFLTDGDRFQFNVAAFNQSNDAGEVALTVQATHGIRLDPPPSPMQLAVNDRVLLPMTAAADAIGWATLTFTGRHMDRTDQVRLSLPVGSGYVTDRRMLLGRVDDRVTLTDMLPAGLAQLPLAALSDDALHGELVLSRSPLIRLRPGISYLLQYPYGCVEQVSSILMPLVGLRDLIRLGALHGIDTDITDKYIENGLEQLLRMQTASGGFAYWPGQRNVSDWGSIYAMAALSSMQNAGMEVPSRSINRGYDYLSDTVTRAQDGERSVEGGTAFEAMALYLLARGAQLEPDVFQTLLGKYDELDPEGRVLTLLAGHISGHLPHDEAVQRLHPLLDQEWQPNPDVYFHARYRGLALRLMAAQAIMPDSGRAEEIADQLLDNMSARGRWSSTSDTGWSLVALGAYLRNQAPHESPVRVSVRYGRDQEHAVTLEDHLPHRVSLDVLQLIGQPNIDIVLDGTSAVYYELALEFPRTDYAKDGFSHGIQVGKRMRNLDGGDTIHVGDVVKVDVDLTVDAHAMHLVLDDPLPAGLVAINSAMATEEPVGESDSAANPYRYWRDDGFFELWPNHFEMHDDRVLVFRDSVWEGAYRYTYYARAVCAGTFRVPPTKAQLMYEPDTRGFTAESQLVVHPR